MAHTIATLLHFGHNGARLRAYPELPNWMTASQVYAAGIALIVVGGLGYALTHARHRGIGLGILAIFAVLGFGGLAHYLVAPMSAHTGGMNATILLESATAVALLLAIRRASALRLESP